MPGLPASGTPATPADLLLVGCGLMGGRHLRGYAELERVRPGSLRLRAVCDPRAETIRSPAPFALHTHVKDGRMEEGKVRFLLPGEGDFDYEAYFGEMAAAGYTGCVTAEVSVQIFDAPVYDAWSAAHFSVETLRGARQWAPDGSDRRYL